MSKTNIRKWTVIGGLAFSLLLAGCGNRQPANVPEPEEEEKPAAETPAAPASPAAPAAPAAPTTPVTTTPAYTAPMVGSLTVSGVEKTKTGFIFKKTVVKGQVVNTSQVPCSGTLKIEFKDKKGIFTKTMVTEETKTVEISTLAPGASQSFEVTSDKTGMDEAEVTVETRQAPAAAAAGYPMGAAAYGAPAPAGYGAPQTMGVRY